MPLDHPFVTAVNANGEKQRIPAAWLEEGHRFASQFRLTARQQKALADADTSPVTDPHTDTPTGDH